MFYVDPVDPFLADLILNRGCSDDEDKYCYRQKYYEKNDKPDNSDFFFPNTCQICGCMPCAENRLFRCSKCQMISYCGKEHQLQHWPNHKNFCKALANTRKRHDFLQVSKGRKQETWMNARLALIDLVSIKLNRKLTPHEQKVIKFPRACLVCHDVDQYNLVDCKNCPSASFCQQHKDLREKIHDEMCPNFKLYYTIELEKLREKNKPVEKKEKSKAKKKDSKKQSESKVKSGWRKDLLLSDEEKEEYLDSDTVIKVIKEAPIKSLPYFEKSPESMRSFLTLIDSNENLSMEKSFEIVDLFTKPLSTFRVLEKLDHIQEKDLIIHVIGAKAEDLDTYLFWETLLHLIPNLISLKVVLFSHEFIRQILSPKLCEKCMEKQKKLIFELYNSGYKKFLEEKPFLEPSLVIGFKIQVKTEAESLECVSNSVTPFAFTSDLDKLTKEEHKNMRKLLGKLVHYEICERNSFSGNKPSLDFKTGGITYEHQFLTIYTNLDKRAKQNKMQNRKSK